MSISPAISPYLNYNIISSLVDCRGGKMKEIIEKLWNEYFSYECAVIDNEEERALIKKAAHLSFRVVDFIKTKVLLIIH